MKQNAILGNDDRLKKDNGGDTRSSRGATDDVRERELENGTVFSEDEVARMMKNFDWVQEALPTPPEIPGYRLTWLSTNHPTDTLHRRSRMGYEPVKAEEVPGFEHLKMKSGAMEGCVSLNEMMLFKLPEPLYQAYMKRAHFDSPLEEERSLRMRMDLNQQDASGRKLGTLEDGFTAMGTEPTRAPKF